jgi:hypothetical protein
VRIERRKIEISAELTTLVREVLEADIRGFKMIDHIELPTDEIEVGMLAGDSSGKVFIVVAAEHSGDSLVLSYGRHVTWLKGRKDKLAEEYPSFDWDKQPGIIMLADDFSPDAFAVVSMLGVSPKICYSIRCLGMGTQKGLFTEIIEVPELAMAQPAAEEGDLLTRAVNGVTGIGEELSVSASFGYVSESLDWIPVANLRRREGKVWIESGPGKWTTRRIEDDESLKEALDKVRQSYQEVLDRKGPTKPATEDNLSQAERESLKWE